MKRPSSTTFNHERPTGVRKIFHLGLAAILAVSLAPIPAFQAFAEEEAPVEESEQAVETEEPIEGEDATDLDADAIFREESAPSDEPGSLANEVDREETDPSDQPASKNMPYVATDYNEIYDLLYSANEDDFVAAAADGEAELGGVLFAEDAAAGTTEAKSESRVTTEEAAMDTAAVSNYYSAGEGNYSETNVQVEGIDEADIIKTDGKYIYRLSTEGEIFILKADGAKSKEVSHFTLDQTRYAETGLNYSSYPFALYLVDGKLVVLRSVSYWNNVSSDDGVQPLPLIEPRAGVTADTEEAADVPEEEAAEDEVAAAEVASDTSAQTTKAETEATDEDSKDAKTSIGQSNVTDEAFDVSRFLIHNPKTALSETLTIIDIFDVTNPEKPTQVYQLAQTGNSSTSRLTGNVLTLITNTYVWNFLDANKDDIGTYIPSTYDNAGVTKVVNADHVFVFPSDNKYDYDNYTTIARFDITTGELLDSYAAMGSFSNTYMSPNALYVARTQWIQNDSDPYEDSVYTVIDSENYSQTTITCMPITEEKLELGASATLDGYLRNQFNMDEYNGYLRVALCDDRSYSRELKDDSHNVDVYQFIESKTTNGVYVLDKSMETVGSIEDIAPGEEIKSVRFDGPMGYVVTFEEIDPLFAISLVSPTNPEILSALKIPGFSSYLHPFGEGRLLGFGQSVENNRTTGLKLSMYDTTDPADITEIATYEIDGFYSEALNDHHAMFVSVDLGIIGVPVDEEYQLFSYSEEDGFTPYPLSDDGKALSSETLGSYGNPRGLFSGDDLYVCSNWVLVVYDLESGDLLTTVEFKDLPNNEPFRSTY